VYIWCARAIVRWRRGYYRGGVELTKQTTVAFSRRQEYAADDYATTLTAAAALSSALTKLNRDNLAFPASDWLYSLWYQDHPPLRDRLDAMDDD